MEDGGEGEDAAFAAADAKSADVTSRAGAQKRRGRDAGSRRAAGGTRRQQAHGGGKGRNSSHRPVTPSSSPTPMPLSPPTVWPPWTQLAACGRGGQREREWDGSKAAVAAAPRTDAGAAAVGARIWSTHPPPSPRSRCSTGRAPWGSRRGGPARGGGEVEAAVPTSSGHRAEFIAGSRSFLCSRTTQPRGPRVTGGMAGGVTGGVRAWGESGRRGGHHDLAVGATARGREHSWGGGTRLNRWACVPI